MPERDRSVEAASAETGLEQNRDGQLDFVRQSSPMRIMMPSALSRVEVTQT